MGRADEHLVLPHEAVAWTQFLRGLAATGAAVGAGGLLAACGSSGGHGRFPRPQRQRRRQARRGPERRTHRRVGSGHPGSARRAHLPRHGPCPVPLPAATPARTRRRRPSTCWPSRSADKAPRPSGSSSCGPGITFHDGKPLTARRCHLHVPQDHQRQASPAASSLGPVDLKRTQGARPAHRHGADDQPVRQLRRPAGVLVLPLHRAGRLSTRSRQPNGTGPFTYQSFTPGQRSVFAQEQELLEVQGCRTSTR